MAMEVLLSRAQAVGGATNSPCEVAASRRQGFNVTIDPNTRAYPFLIREFVEFFFPGDSWLLARQLAWIDQQMARNRRPAVFLFRTVM